VVQTTDKRGFALPGIRFPRHSNACPVAGTLHCFAHRHSDCSLERRRCPAPPPPPPSPHPLTAPPNSTTSRANLCSALPGPPCVSLARDVLECWGLNASQRVKRAFPDDLTVLTTAAAGVCARDCGSFADSARCGRARWPAGLGGTAHRASRSSRHTSPGLSGHQCQCFFFGISARLPSRCVTTHPCSIVCVTWRDPLGQTPPE
jgi:hypothetical protein